MNRFSIRPLEQQDIPHILDYWLKATPEYLLAMGANAGRFPSRAEWQASLEKTLITPERQATNFYLIWLVDGRPIGFNSLKNIVYGDRGEMHLHVWDSASRGRGYGGPLFCLAAIEFFKRFALKQIYCEPSASNAPPNKLLRQIGFPLVLTHTTASSELSLVCEVNRYDIRREIAEDYLRAKAGITGAGDG
jgi:RimJ/RimL family protein N-acetyltransferase